MGMMDGVLMELEHEGGLTRKVLERVPEDKFDYKPHEKSMTMGQLAAHIAQTYSWAESMIPDEFVLDMNEYQPYEAKTNAELLAFYDEHLAKAKGIIKGVDDAAAMGNWKMSAPDGTVMMEMPRIAVIKSMLINHIIHHRGQLEVYLRLNDVPLPSLYGPSADEGGM